MSAHEGTVSESTTPEAKKREDRKWEGKDLIQFSRFWFPKILRDALSIYVSLISCYFLQQHILGLVLQEQIKEQIDSIFFLCAPDDGILDKKMHQPLKSINTSFMSCLKSTDNRTDWFFAFPFLFTSWMVTAFKS